MQSVSTCRACLSRAVRFAFWALAAADADAVLTDGGDLSRAPQEHFAADTGRGACHTAKEEDPCYAHVLWSKETGIFENPDWYSGLSPTSSRVAFQAHLHRNHDYDCPPPCEDGTPTPFETKYQEGASISSGRKIRFYTVGSSNVVWETWPDQLHAMLKRLGYDVMGSAYELASMTQPTRVPVCDDAAEYSTLHTPRVGRVGWSSWGFAYESRDDCGEDGFRDIAGHNVSCANAWACDPAGQSLVRPSKIAEEARHSHFVLVSNWINDSRQNYAQFKCFGGEDIDAVATALITVENLRRLIQAIHARNPDVKVLVMARYPGAAGVNVNVGDLSRIRAVNAAVEKAIVAAEPNTLFVDYSFPPGEMFQTKSFGHPNCRGDRVMATAVLDTLFRHKIIATSLSLGPADECLGSDECGSLRRRCCQRSAFCHVAANTSCLAYGPGVQ